VKHPVERRFRKTEVRAKSDGHIEGHASVFDQEYVLWDSASYRVVEVVKPGAFARALKEKQDVRALNNHDPSQLLGRTSAKTLSLEEDDQGLYFDCDPPDTQVGRDVRTLIQRGDISGCSFGFTVGKDTVTETNDGQKTIRRREINEIRDLFDVSTVTYPAYEGTDVAARSIELRSLFPSGVPASLAGAIPECRKDSDNDGDDDDVEQECRCRCRACYSGECEECDMHMQDCGDQERCNHLARSIQRGDAPTRRVDGEDLTAGCYIYVGDPAKPETWALPWKFKSQAKIKSHLRNALARFGQTQKIPADKKAAAWKKLVRLCKKYGIAVSDEEAKSLGLSVEQRKELRSGACDCVCPDCLNGDCENCSDVNCDDANCDHGDRAGLLGQEQAKARARALKLSL
jgi:Escherichia/Staphylococcus phage prohead protease